MRKRFWFLAFIFVVGVVVLTRDALLAKGAEIYVSRKMTSYGWNFESMQREKNTLTIQNLRYEDSSGKTLIEEMTASFHLSLFPLQCQPSIAISRAFLEVLPDQNADNAFLGLFFALGDPRFDLKLSINEGEVKGVLKEPFAFSFAPGKEKREIGTLSIQNVEGNVFLSAHLKWEGESLVSELEIEKGKAADLMALTSLIPNNTLQGWSQGEGEVSASLKSRFHPEKGLEEMEGKMDLQEISFSHPELGVKLFSQSLKGTLLFFPDKWKEEKLSLWKKVELFLTFEDTHLSIGQKGSEWGAEDVLGEIRLNPLEDPYLKIGGRILSEGRAIPFEMEGKGQLLEKGTYWLQTQADFFLPKNSPHISLAFHQSEKEEGTFEVECTDFSQEVFNVLQLGFPLFHWPECKMHGGTFEGKFVGSFEKGILKSLTFSDCTSEKLAFSIPSQSIAVKSQTLAFSGLLERNEKGLLEVASLESEIRKVDLSFQNKEMLQSISAHIGVQSGEFIASYIEGFYQGIWGSIQMLDPASKDLLHIECKALTSDLISKIRKEESLEKTPANPVFLAVDVSPQDGKTYGSAICRLTASSGIEEDVEIQMTLDKQISRNIRDLFSGWDFSSYQGSFQTERLSSETGSFWLRPWLGALALKGFLKGEGLFDEKGISMEISLADFNLSDASWDVSAKLGTEEKKMHVAYEYKEGLLKGSVPVDVIHLQNRLLKLEAEIQDSLFFFEGNQLWTDHFQTDIEGSNLFGSLLIDKSGVHIASKSFEGSLSSLRPLLNRHAPQVSLVAWDGLFAIGDRSCLLEGKKQGDEWAWDWKASVHLKDLACDLDKKGMIHQGRCLLEGNSKGNFALKELQGIYSLSAASCPFALSDFHWSSHLNSSEEFSLLAKDGKREWVYLQGKMEKQKEGVKVSLAPHSHILGLVVDVAPFMINSELNCSPLKVSSALQLEKLPLYLTMWKEMGILVQTSPFLASYQGTMQVQAMYDMQKASWKATFDSSEVSYLKNVIGKASGTILGEGKSIKVDSCQIGPWSAKGSFDALPTEWAISSLMIQWPEGKCLMKGRYNTSLSQLQIPAFSAAFKGEKVGNVQVQGSFEGNYVQTTSSFQGKGLSRCIATLPSTFGIALESSKEISFAFDSTSGVQVEKSQWDVTSLASTKQKIGKISTKSMTYLTKENRFLLQGGSLSLTKELSKVLQNFPSVSEALKELKIDQEIDVQGDLDLSSQYKKISGTIKNGTYAIKETSFDLKQTKFLIEQDQLYASCQTKCQEEPIWLQLQMNLKAPLSACLLVKEHPEKKGLNLLWKNSLKEGWYMDAIQGSMKGISLQMQKKQKELGKNVYDLQMNADFSQVSTLLPKVWSTNIKKWGLGQGYAFQGTLVLDAAQPFQVSSLKGDVTGENFEFLGKSFDALSAKLDFTADKGRIYGVKLEDEVAGLTIKTLDFLFNPKIKTWDVTSPLVYVKNFAPALFLKGRKERGVEIKNLSLQEVKGSLNNLESFEAKGALYFSSLEKRAFSFWDVPLGLMKDWGLDPGLLTPETGEADFVLRQGRFYFTALRNVYSEGKRSQFHLARDGSDAYLALDGSWHVDLAMKQNVVWKVTEDLILSIRGTVEKPKYSFKSGKNAY